MNKKKANLMVLNIGSVLLECCAKQDVDTYTIILEELKEEINKPCEACELQREQDRRTW